MYETPRGADGKHTGEPNTALKKIVIQGGANVAISAPGNVRNISTRPCGETLVTDDELEFLEAHPSFQKMIKEGYVSVRKSKVDLQKAVNADMKARDKAAPATPKMYEKANAENQEMWEGDPSSRQRKVFLGAVGTA